MVTQNLAGADQWNIRPVHQWASGDTGVVSHELSHQWYGDMITCKDWHHIWLNEGFATYSEAVYLEARDGKAAYNSQIASDMSSARNATWNYLGSGYYK